MSVLKLIVAYDGTNYHGFAKQINALTIQEVLEKAIYTITKEEVEVIGAGRTDAGVHARGQCCICHTNTKIPIEKLRGAINSKLPKDIVVREATWAEDCFHPRFDAKRKTYRYEILNSLVRDPFFYPYTYFFPHLLNLEKMKEAATYMVGTHDFKCFCAVGTSVKTTVRTIYSLEIKKIEDCIQIDVCGNGFLYNMVRIIVGTLIHVGTGKIPPEKIKTIIESKKRELAGPTAPPEGLMMLQIEYQKDNE